MKTFRRAIALVLAFVLAFSCLAVESFAAKTIKDVKIVKEPTKKVYYKGTDWDYGYWKFGDSSAPGTFKSHKSYIAFMYNGGLYSRYQDVGMLDLRGLVVEVTYSDGSKEQIAYKETKSGVKVTQNIYFSPVVDFMLGDVDVYVYFLENKAACDIFTITLTDKAALRGDVNEDTAVNSADALLVLQHSVGQITLTGSRLQAADLNADGIINSADALKILKIAVGQES